MSAYPIHLVSMATVLMVFEITLVSVMMDSLEETVMKKVSSI